MSRCPPSQSALFVLSTLALCLFGCGGGGGGGPSSVAPSDAAARLTSLSTSVGVLSPAFEPGITDYIVWMSASNPSVLLTPIPADAGATVTVNGGLPGLPLTLVSFQTVVDIVVTSPDGATAITYTVVVLALTTRDLIDPTPGAFDRFGHSLAVLGNGNVVVTDPYDGTGALQAGAVHLYHPVVSVAPFVSLYGNSVAELMGQRGITVLANDNFVVSSAGGVNSAGTVRLVDGSTGSQIGPTLVSALPDDFDSSRVTALANGNYVVTASREDAGGMVDTGAVRLFNGTSGTQIGTPLVGDVAGDRMGSDGIAALPNSNFVVRTPNDDENGVVDVGSARLMSGTTGVPLGPGVVGEVTYDIDSTYVTPLAGGRFVLATDCDDEGGLVDAGAVRVFNSASGAQIGATLVGATAGARVGRGGAKALANGNYVIAAPGDDVGGVVDAGSVRVFSGTTGAQIGSALVGDNASDGLGRRVIALANGNFAVASYEDDVGGIVDAGSVRLVSGTTGVQIGPALAGDEADDRLGASRLVALSNGNFVVASASDDVGGLVNAGSVRLVDGVTGLQVGPTLAGAQAGDGLGSSGGITALVGGGYVVSAPTEDQGGLSQSGTVRLFNGTSGAQIGPTLAGDVAADRVGSLGAVALANGNFVVRSPSDNEGGVVDAGSVRLLSGVTGMELIPAITGITSGDVASSVVAAPLHGGFFVVGLAMWDNGSVDSGRVRLIAE